MKIKRYAAPTMRAALAQVRSEQGPDAVILSSRRGEEGIEVIAAVDYDEALFVDATRQRVPDPLAAPVPPPVVAEPAVRTAPVPRAEPPRPAAPLRAAPPPAEPPPRPASPPRVEPALRPAPLARTQAAFASRQAQRAQEQSAPVREAPPPRPAPMTRAVPARAMPPARATAPRSAGIRPDVPVDEGYLAMQREFKDLRRLLETGLAGMTWSDKRLREPLRAQILEDLSAMDIAPDVAAALAALAPRRTSLDNPSKISLAMLIKHLPVVDDLAAMYGGVTAVVGPTGAGKTTTIAKLAAQWCLKHGSEDLALVSTDGYRIGARDQLMTFARILGAPMHSANNARELTRVMERLQSKKMIFIDTAGMGPRDARLNEQLAALQIGAARARVLLALPAQGEAHALDEIVKAFARLSPAACVLTKVDEAASLGAALSTALRHRLKIAYVCDGQRVPEDLHAAHQRRVWLVRAALKLKENKPPQRDESYLIRTFGRVPAHA
jgi:flagellar biosynthesis protein FlhF